MTSQGGLLFEWLCIYDCTHNPGKRAPGTSAYPLNRIPGTVLYIGPLILQASLRARDLARYRELVGVGHRFGNVSVLATMPSQIYPEEKLEWTSNADRLKFEG